jgi:hypothetical protein
MDKTEKTFSCCELDVAGNRMLKKKFLPWGVFMVGDK